MFPHKISDSSAPCLWYTLHAKFDKLLFVVFIKYKKGYFILAYECNVKYYHWFMFECIFEYKEE